MLDGISPRNWLGIGIVVATAVVVLALSYDIQVTITALVGGLVALLAASRTPEEDAAFTTPAPVESAPAAPPALDPLLDAIVEPVLLLEGNRVALANGAARALLGNHIIGEDARTAIRHPAAIEHLTGTAADGALAPVELIGLGALEQRWEMRARPVGPDRRLIHLVNQTGNYAAEKMRVDFVANASHELRTPLASILGYVETLADEAGDDPETRARFLKVVFNEARRMERLVEDLMSLSRIEAEKFRLPAESVDLPALVGDVVAALAAEHSGRGRDIVPMLAEGLPPVVGDRAQLSQVLHNLIGNAMKYGRARTPIRVEAVLAAPGTVQIVVADQGDGIAPEHLPRLTERFYRVDAGRSRSLGGTGLGLAIVKHIVERHRGRLEIASTIGEGTRIAITLRAVDGAVITA